MNLWNSVLRSNRRPAWAALLPCLLLLAPLAACGPAEDDVELVELDEDAGRPPAGTESPSVEETPPEPAPLGPELEAPPPGDPAPPEDMPVTPEELEEDLDAAEPVPAAPAPLPAAETQVAGKEVFLAQRCDTCHAVASAGVEGKSASGGDLSGVGERLDRAGIEAALRGEEMTGGRRHPKRFTGTQADLDALIDWLLAQE